MKIRKSSYENYKFVIYAINLDLDGQERVQKIWKNTKFFFGELDFLRHIYTDILSMFMAINILNYCSTMHVSHQREYVVNS